MTKQQEESTKTRSRCQGINQKKPEKSSKNQEYNYKKTPETKKTQDKSQDLWYGTFTTMKTITESNKGKARRQEPSSKNPKETWEKTEYNLETPRNHKIPSCNTEDLWYDQYMTNIKLQTNYHNRSPKSNKILKKPGKTREKTDYNLAQCQDYDAVQRMRMQIDIASEAAKMAIRDFFYRCKLRLHSNGAEKLVGYLITQAKQYTRRSVARIGYESAGITRRHEHRVLKVFLQEQKKLEKETGLKLINIKSGKKTWNVNTYIIHPMIYDFVDIIQDLLETLPDKGFQYVINSCHTIVKNIILGTITITKNSVMYTPPHDAKRFFQRKKEKACASELSSTRQTPGVV
jgi:hypothetical protein